MEKCQAWYKELIGVDGYTPDATFVVDGVLYPESKGMMWHVADLPTGCLFHRYIRPMMGI